MVTWPWPRPFRGIFFISRLGLAMINLCTKFKVPACSRYEDMNSGAKYTNWGSLGTVRGHSGLAAMSPFDRAHTTSYSTNRNYASIFYRFRDIGLASYLLKVADFDPPHLHLAPPQGVIPVEFCRDLWHQKTSVPAGYRVVLFMWSYV